MDDDFEYDTGRVIPRNDTNGWKEFEANRAKAIKNFLEMGFINFAADAFFKVPLHKQIKLQEEHPSLKEAWEHYLVLLAMIYEEENGTRP